jgi:hypothetical protein
MKRKRNPDAELDGASVGLRQAILVRRHARRGPAQAWDAPPLGTFPGPKVEPLPGQLVLGQGDADEEQEAPAA